MKKKLAVIALAALLISAAGCNTNTNTQTSTEGTISITESSEFQSFIESAEKSEDTAESKNSEKTSKTEDSKAESSTVKTEFTSTTTGKIDTTDMFSNRDLEQTPDTSDAKTIQVTDGQTINITEEGTYIISGTASNCTIKVEAEKESKVQLVLDGVNITNDSTPAIYVVSADKCFITTTASSENTLTVTSDFTADGDTNTDAVIFSKDDIVFNGLGTLTISSTENGISGKDGIKFTGGTYSITSTKHCIEANDFIAVCGGTFELKSSSKSGLHCENDDDDTVGWIYISDGTFNITSVSDGIRGTTYIQIDGGTINISSTEGIESTYIQINGGTVNVSAVDDGLNASQKSTAVGTPTVEVTGGELTVTMSGNDVDGIDSNGNIIVSGGTININYPAQAPSESFDCDGTATYTGGTIIINGTQVDSIPQSMMGGGGMMGGGRGGRGMMMPGQMPNGTM